MTKFLDEAYDLDGVQATQELYARWSATYDAEVAEAGYATPPRCAEALRAAMARSDLPILDFGCGTGLSGVALRAAGFSVIDGCDISAEMLAGAAAREGVYRNLTAYDPAGDLPFAAGDYHAIAAIGVIGAGAAPAEVLDTLVDHLEPEGLLVFSFNDHTLADPVYESALNRHLDAGRVTLLSKEYGPHLPGKGLNSFVYVIQRQ
ncbi:class I SAM-dependent DNA methyltransferase [Pseudaestuariivita sp.]|uniref:class I SAM-dependent DNA methyltransferase n=1 Tax=Pseudaestuariivita sp. TaxID=2211669 RepID=UPI00405A379D